MSTPLVYFGNRPLQPLNTKMRHGFDEDYNSENLLTLLANTFYIYFDDKRHNANGNPISDEMKRLKELYKNYQPIVDWKVMKERQKTISAVLVLCLNLGVDPPDIMKTYPCAKYEAWCDPAAFSDTKKAIEAIGKNLQLQYETLSLRTRYKQLLDPCVEDVKRFCNTLRRNAKEERILFHYNGHGVPQPTALGEIWVFNRGYTQYIPISLYDLQTWLGAPVIFVYDCNSAGNIVHNFKKFVQKRIDDDNEGNHDLSAPLPTLAYLDLIQLAACKSNETLPMTPDLPADLFTCCLTCPIDILVKWFIMLLPLKKFYLELLPRSQTNGNVLIPGKLTDRRTPLGELNWIFTAITDTIAWLLLSRPIFKKLFRQDLMVAALFRNFLLAKRIMPLVNCTPVSDPPLPELVKFHAMWDLWDLAIDQVFTQLIRSSLPSPLGYQLDFNGKTPSQTLTNYQHLTFFEQQLTAFDIWLKYEGPLTKNPPEQLPIVLQVLLLQVHRLRALILLLKFLDLGPWAVYLLLLIGIFPYVLKLLQSPAQELKPVLIFIWTRIMAIDYKLTQQELCKDKGYNYFYLILNLSPNNAIGAPNAPGSVNGATSVVVNEDHKAMSAFILTLFIKDFKNGQRLCFSIELVTNCLRFIQHSENPLLRQWCCLLLLQLWNKYRDGRWIIYKDGYLLKFLTLVDDPIPEVRTLMVVALTNFLTDTEEQPKKPGNEMRQDELRQQDLRLANVILRLIGDGSTIVRREIVYFINRFIGVYAKFFLVVAFNQLEEEICLIDSPQSLHELRKKLPAYGSVFSSMWKALLILLEDPHLEVKQLAETVIDSVMVRLGESELAELVKEMQDYLLGKLTINISDNFGPVRPVAPLKKATSGPVLNNNTLTVGRARLALHGDDAELISLKLKNFSVSKLFKSFHINEDSELTRILSPGRMPSRYGAEYKPKTPRFRPRDLKEEPRLAESSGFFEYSCEYFQEPQMLKNETDEAGSAEYMKRLWRRNRNEQTIQETQPQKKLAVRGDWNRKLTVLGNRTQPKLIKFMQFEKNLVATDEKDTVSVWDWETEQIVLKFSNGNPFGTKITDLKFLNEDDVPLVMTGSLDGVIKMYKNFYLQDQVEVVAAWRALTDLLLTLKSSGLISEWQQSRGLLLVSGDVKLIRVWDAPRELCILDIPARSSSSITSLTSDQVAGNVFVAGFDDGSLRVYDRRLDARELMVKLWQSGRNGVNAGRGSIRNVHMQRGGFRELVSGSADGYVNLWDIRASEPVLSFQDERSIRCIDVHEHAPIITTGSKSVNLWTTSGDKIHTLRSPHDHLLATRTLNYLANVTFHPHRMMVATNYHQDGQINVYECTDIVQEY